MKEGIILPYIYYLVVLLIVTGFLILIIDVSTFKKIQMEKEKKFASFLGWTNVLAAALLFIGYWAYQKWFW